MQKGKVLILCIAAMAAAVLLSRCTQGGASAAESSHVSAISYNFDVRPLLSDKCFACHGPDAQKRESGLRLDIEADAKAALPENPGKYAIVPGKPEESELIRRITTANPDEIMPPPGAHLGALNEQEVAILRRWIKEGAVYETHWAFAPPQKVDAPEVNNKIWNSHAIDKFLYATMQSKGLTPNPQADAATLLKRIALDITGLPPSESLKTFYMANPAQHYEATIDSLLQSVHYGEKMAIHWCDVGRYADSYGYQDDNIRTQWPWRDWVIHAFNRNMPYNDFVLWQLAGDMLPNATKEQILATGFLRNHKYTEEGGVIPEEYRVEYLVDKVKTYTKGMLALTVECAQCHDHKYDPISQEDYYSIYAFFNNTPEVGYQGDVSTSQPAKTPVLAITQQERDQLMHFISRRDTGTLTVSVMGELDKPRPTYILNRGVYDAPGRQVQPSTPAAVLPFDTARWQPNRLGLAQWTVSEKNPLTARVWVNRIWLEIFGKGLVSTTGDFGMQGSLPSHPALLDWLAADFVEHGWDTKRLIKQILMSAAYQQAATVSKQQLERDPDNIYLSRYPRQRLKAELLRDWVLATAGLLHPEVGGPSVKPYQPAGLWEAATSGRGVLASYKQDVGEKLYRRGLYTFIKLTVPPPSMVMFDASNRDQCEVERSQTNTPLQALVMLNDPTVLEAARVLAQQLVARHGTATPKALGEAYSRIACRPADKAVVNKLATYVEQQRKMLEKETEKAEKLLQAGMYPYDNKLPKPQVAALMQAILVLYNLDDTITKS